MDLMKIKMFIYKNPDISKTNDPMLTEVLFLIKHFVLNKNKEREAIV